MGGWGSGAYGPMGSKVRRRTVEETYQLKIQDLKNCLDNKNLTYSWNNGKMSIGVITKKDCIVLLYKANEEKIMRTVNIDSTEVGYGKRLWFNCPECDERTAKLYLVGKHFACRDCQNLTYFSCQESGDPLDYFALKIERLQRKLGMKKPEIYERPILKPKNMHYKTFMSLRNQLIELQEKRDQEFLRICGVRWG